MENIASLATQQLTKLSQQLPNETEKNSSKKSSAKKITSLNIDNLWKKFTRIYGHKWVSNFGKMDDGTWLSGLSGLSPDQIVFGIAQCINRGNPWPPSLPEFRSICFDLPDIQKMVWMVLENINDPAAKKIRQRIGSYNINSLCGGAWTQKYLEDKIKIEYENITETTFSCHEAVTEQLSDLLSLPRSQ